MAKSISYGFIQISNETRMEIIKRTQGHSGNCMLVYMTLLSQIHRKRDDKYLLCCPSIEFIAKENGISISTVKSALKTLRENKIIEYSPGARNVCNIYFFPLESFYEESIRLFPIAFMNTDKINSGGFKKEKKKQKFEYIENDDDDIII